MCGGRILQRQAASEAFFCCSIHFRQRLEERSGGAGMQPVRQVCSTISLSNLGVKARGIRVFLLNFSLHVLLRAVYEPDKA